MTATDRFPEVEWQRTSPEEVGLSPDGLEAARKWLQAHRGERPCRVVIVRHGMVAAEWNFGADGARPMGIASAAKSLYSNILGIAIDEGAIASADALVCDYYAEMMDVPPGGGPKEGRHAFPKDSAITFRQLICNVSGYMKPDEEPGEVFHYQTYGMNILTHALAKAYGHYDVADPEGSPGFSRLIEEKLSGPIGARLEFSLSNFDLHPKARLNIFGYYCQVHTTPLDFARLGWLWCNNGQWGSRQIVPAAWMDESARTNAFIVQHGVDGDRRYGHGFWTNDSGQLWTELPRDGFTASGAGGHYASVFPGMKLVVVQNPGPYVQDDFGSAARGNPEFLEIVVGAVKS